MPTHSPRCTASLAAAETMGATELLVDRSCPKPAVAATAQDARAIARRKRYAIPYSFDGDSIRPEHLTTA
jgi:hypothetical protein